MNGLLPGFTDSSDVGKGFWVLPAAALDLAWMACRALGVEAEAPRDFVLTKARIWFDNGQKFGAEGRG